MIKQVACVAIATTALAAFCDAATVVRASVSLKDGSSVKGEFLTKHISGSTLFKKDLALAPAIVRNITFTGTNGESKVELVNSDRFAMTVTNDAFAVRSMLGDLKIPRKNFRSISLSARSAGTEGGAADGLIFHCTFDDERSIVSPAVGPAGRFMTGGFMEGKSGQALMTVPYTRHAAFDFPAGFLKDAGCVAFWAKILKQTPSVGDGGDPRLLAIFRADTHDFVSRIDVVSNDGSGNSGFAMSSWFGAKSSMNGMRYLRYSDLFPSGNWRDWHHYALVWDKNGIPDLPDSPKTALLVDGKVVASAGFGLEETNGMRMPSEMAHVLGITCDPAIDPERNTKSPFLIDELKIWDYSKVDSFDAD